LSLRPDHELHLLVRRLDAKLPDGAFERGLFVGRLGHTNEAGRRVGFGKFNVPIMKP
jgi:hypothetical protein